MFEILIDASRNIHGENVATVNIAHTRVKIKVIAWSAESVAFARDIINGYAVNADAKTRGKTVLRQKCVSQAGTRGIYVRDGQSRAGDGRWYVCRILRR